MLAMLDLQQLHTLSTVGQRANWKMIWNEAVVVMGFVRIAQGHSMLGGEKKNGVLSSDVILPFHF
jgi:hypothetical protein